MKIKLTNQQAFCLAQVFAEEIHARVTEMHLWTCDHVFHTHDSPCFTKEPSRAFDEVCQAIRSLKVNSYERRAFVSNVKFHFNNLRKERGTYTKWQDHLARVKEVNKELVPAPWRMEAAA